MSSISILACVSWGSVLAVIWMVLLKLLPADFLTLAGLLIFLLLAIMTSVQKGVTDAKQSKD